MGLQRWCQRGRGSGSWGAATHPGLNSVTVALEVVSSVGQWIATIDQVILLPNSRELASQRWGMNESRGFRGSDPRVDDASPWKGVRLVDTLFLRGVRTTSGRGQPRRNSTRFRKLTRIIHTAAQGAGRALIDEKCSLPPSQSWPTRKSLLDAQTWKHPIQLRGEPSRPRPSRSNRSSC